MTREEVDRIVISDQGTGWHSRPELVETHISWVLLGDEYVYKIKKPVKFPFLDFSTPEKRKHFCEQELTLNRRLAPEVYVDVQSIKEHDGRMFIGSGVGKTLDYAVRLKKMPSDKRMDVLLQSDLVSFRAIESLADQMAAFHKTTGIIPRDEALDIRKEFNALGEVSDFFGNQLGGSVREDIKQAISMSDDFLDDHFALLTSRSSFYRDCHGDFHCQNIFLLPEPVIFDCIEFNDRLRYTDVLNEVAFLCMDLEASGRQDLAKHFIVAYNALIPVIRSEEEERLFEYYKSYRANIRAKVFALKAASGSDEEQREALANARRYFDLMGSYLSVISC